MSESDDAGLTAVVTEEVTNQVGISELLGDGNLEDEIDGGELGAAVGRKFGEQFGRELGGAIGREIHETIAEGVEEGRSLSELRSDVTSAVKDGVSDGVDELGGRQAVASLAQSATEGSPIEGLLDREESTGEADVTDDTEAEAVAEDEDTEEEAEDEAAEAVEEEAEDEDEAEPEPSGADLEDLRRETLTDFLGVMSYEDLQSIAKDVGVRANLGREEMTEEIIQTVTDEEEASDSGESADDGESANDETAQEAE